MNNENPEKKKALEMALGQIEKQFGKGLSLIHIQMCIRDRYNRKTA